MMRFKNNIFIGASEYMDCKSNVHKLTHMINTSEADREELENNITEELYRIFTGTKNI